MTASSTQTTSCANEMAKQSTRDVSGVALKSASSLMGLQLFSRLATFVLNQALVRLSTPQVYGTVSIQLELFLNTVLFLSREGFRNALLRADSKESTETKSKENRISPLVSNIALLPVYTGLGVCGLVVFLYIKFASPITKSQPHFVTTVAVYAVAALIELLSEPLFIRSTLELRPSIRLRAEGLAVLLRSSSTLLLLLYDTYFSAGRESSSLGLLAFACGQLIYALTFFLVFSYEYGSSMTYHFRPSRVSEVSGSKGKQREEALKDGAMSAITEKYFDEDLLKVALVMTSQGVLKHALTEGDKLIIARLSPLKDQGGYAVANNYGSLIARIIFQPIEESFRLFFSKTISPQARTYSNLNSALSYLYSVLLVYTYMSLFFVTFGPSLVYPLSALFMPSMYLNSSAPIVLSAWVYYIPILAVNGILEAFVSSVSSSEQIIKQSRWMAVSSTVYIASSYLLYAHGGLGDSALIYANSLNLSLRIAYCSQFLISFVQHRPKPPQIGNKIRDESNAQVESPKEIDLPSTFVPPISVVLSFTVAFGILRLGSTAYHINNLTIKIGRRVVFTKQFASFLILNIICLLIVVGISIVFERDKIHRLIGFVKGRFGSKHKLD